MTIDIGIRPEEFENITAYPSPVYSCRKNSSHLPPPGVVSFVVGGKRGSGGRVSVLGGFPVPDVDDERRGSRSTGPRYFQPAPKIDLCFKFVSLFFFFFIIYFVAF